MLTDPRGGSASVALPRIPGVQFVGPRTKVSTAESKGSESLVARGEPRRDSMDGVNGAQSHPYLNPCHFENPVKVPRVLGSRRYAFPQPERQAVRVWHKKHLQVDGCVILYEVMRICDRDCCIRALDSAPRGCQYEG